MTLTLKFFTRRLLTFRFLAGILNTSVIVYFRAQSKTKLSKLILLVLMKSGVKYLLQQLLIGTKAKALTFLLRLIL